MALYDLIHEPLLELYGFFEPTMIVGAVFISALALISAWKLARGLFA